MAIPIIAAVIGAGAAIAGAVGQSNAQNEASARNAEYIEQQYQQDLKKYKFDWAEQLREYQHVKYQVGIQRAREETIAQLQDTLALQQYENNLAIRDYEYLNNLRQFEASEKRYNTQKYFNNLAAGLAYDSEIQRLREIEIGSSFDQQDAVVEMLQQEGLMQAKGVSGRSASKAINSVLAQYGRNQAVLAESLVSARRQTGKNMQDITLNKYGADLAAENSRMLAPVRGPDGPAPLRTPRGVFLDPLQPRQGPEPVRGVNTVTRASSLGIVAGIAGGIAGGISTYQGLKTK